MEEGNNNNTEKNKTMITESKEEEKNTINKIKKEEKIITIHKAPKVYQ